MKEILFSAFVKSVWDPLSTSQTKNLVQLCNNIFEKQVLSKNECSRAKEVKLWWYWGRENFIHGVSFLWVLLRALRMLS